MSMPPDTATPPAWSRRRTALHPRTCCAIHFQPDSFPPSATRKAWRRWWARVSPSSTHRTARPSSTTDFDIQREIAPRTVVTASYVGSRAWDLSAAPTDFTTAINENVNQLNPQYLSLGTPLLAAVPNPFFGIITNGSLAGPTVPQSQLLKLYPQFTGVTRMAPAFGNSHYEAAQLQLEKRTSSGVTALVAYTVAKNIGDLTNAGNAYNRQAERGLTSFDVPQRLSVSVA